MFALEINEKPKQNKEKKKTKKERGRRYKPRYESLRLSPRLPPRLSPLYHAQICYPRGPLCISQSRDPKSHARSNRQCHVLGQEPSQPMDSNLGGEIPTVSGILRTSLIF